LQSPMAGNVEDELGANVEDDLEAELFSAMECSEDSHLNFLPEDLKFRVFSHLSASFLHLIVLVNRDFKKLSTLDSLWKPLFLQRWVDTEICRGSWKTAYFLRDCREHDKLINDTKGECQTEFLVMQAAQRSLCLSESKKVALTRKRPLSEVSDWRQKQKFRPDPTHQCSGKTCEYLVSGRLYVCKNTGKEHLCGEDCVERTSVSIGYGCEAVVCPVSGLQLDQWVRGEEEAEEDPEAKEYEGTSSFFANGYGADEDEMKSMIRSFGGGDRGRTLRVAYARFKQRGQLV